MMKDKKRMKNRLRFVFFKNGSPFLETVDDEIKETVKLFIKREANGNNR